MRENVPGLRTSPSVVEVDVEVQVFVRGAPATFG
jgi:hypothetical protein